MNRLYLVSYIEVITLGAGEDIYEVAGRVCNMDLDGIGEFGAGLLQGSLLGCLGQVLQQALFQA